MPKPSNKPQPKGNAHKEGTTFIAAWIPDEVVAQIDRAVIRDDTDRSKLIRKALRQYLSR
jgi:metal-responsive CopG/Arc/MetJ family transcriptional regulator